MQYVSYTQRIGMQLQCDGKVDSLCKTIRRAATPKSQEFGGKQILLTREEKKTIARPKGRSVTQGGDEGEKSS